MTLGERIQHLEVEGYVVVPDLLSPEEIARLKTLVAPIETKAADYSDKQRGRAWGSWGVGLNYRAIITKTTIGRIETA